MNGRWNRMHQIFKILDNSPCTVAEMREHLLQQGDDLSRDHINFLLRHYNKISFLNRKKDKTSKYNPYIYRLSEKGVDQLDWLNLGGHLRYIEKYNEENNIPAQ